MKKLTSKGKHTVKVGNHLHTNMIIKTSNYEKRRVQMQDTGNAFKLEDQQLKTILFIYRLLYQNLMVTTNQKSTIDTHTHTHTHTKGFFGGFLTWV